MEILIFLVVLVFFVIAIVVAIAGVLYLVYKDKNTEGDISSWAQGQATNKFDPNMNRFQAEKEAIASQARNQLLVSLQAEVTNMAGVLIAETHAQMAEFAKRDAFRTYTAMQASAQLEVQLREAMVHNQIQSNQKASEFGLSPAAFEQLVLESAKSRTMMVMEEQKMLLGVKQDKLMKENEFFLEQKLHSLDVELSNLANLLPQRKVMLLGEMLKGVHQEFEKVKQLGEGDFKESELRRLDEHRKTLEAEIYET